MGSPAKCTKMDQNILKWSLYHDTGKCFKFVLSDSYDLEQMETWKDGGVRASHGGVMGSHMRCTKMDQNRPKWSPYHDISKVFQICPEWLIWSFSGLNRRLKGDKSQYKPWRGHGVIHEVHQNAPKRIKMDQNGHNIMTKQRVSNLSWVTYMIFFWIKWTLERG